MIFWTSATWILTYPLVLLYGFVGVAIASAIVAITSSAIIYFVKKEVKVSVAKNIFGPLFISVLMFIIVKYLAIVYITSIFTLLITIFIGALIYIILSLSFFKRYLIEDAKIIIKSLIFNK